MAERTPTQIQRFLDDNLHRFDMPVQYLGDEPNAVRKPWDTATVRWMLAACWVYEAAAGNSSIPAVYKSINDGREGFLCDRTYLPNTPRDLGLLEKAGIPMFGIESKHQMRDFDVVGTSISYPVLSMSWVKLLSMSDIPIRWRDRAADAGTYPMVMAGGQSFGAPEMLAPVVDCWWLGEVEDEPGNPGITAVCDRIARFKATGAWLVDRIGCYAVLAQEFRFLYFPRFVEVIYDHEDRTRVGVGPHRSKQVVGFVSKLPGMRLPFRKRHVQNLDDAAPLTNPPLLYADPAMGSGDLEVARGCPAWCSFCALCLSGDTSIITRSGIRVLRDLVEQSGVQVWTAAGWRDATVEQFGTAPLNRITFAPAAFAAFLGGETSCRNGHSRIDAVGGEGRQRGRNSKLTLELAEAIRARHAAGGITQAALAQEYGVAGPQISLLLRGLAWMPPAEQPALSGHTCRTCMRIKRLNAYYIKTGRPENVQVLQEVEGWARDRGWHRLPKTTVHVVHEATADHRWPLVDGTETRQLQIGDVVRAEYVADADDVDAVERGFVHGMVFGDGTACRSTRQGKIYSLGLFGAKDYAHAGRFRAFLREDLKYGRTPVEGIAVLRLGASVPSGKNGVLRSEVRLVTDVSMKEFPPGDAPPGYLRGFLEGWLAADGTAALGAASIRLSSQHPAARAWLDQHAACAGYVFVAARQDSVLVTNFQQRKHPLFSYTLSRIAGWKVISIEAGSEPVPVFCATVPGEGFFTLASGVYTGNSWRTKPYRQRTVGNVLSYAKAFQDNMGSVRMAPFSPDFPMYTQKKRLIGDLLEQVSDEVDAPTMRVDDFIADNDFILLQVNGGMDAVTLGVEGNSQRMRDLVGKGTSDEDVKQAVTRGIRAGIRKFKLYMITNFPGEDEGDHLRILQLAKDLADIRESMHQPTVRIQFSWTPLMIEANTPFQWFAPQLSSRLLGDVWEECRALKIDPKLGAKAEPNKLAFFQLCQRASRDVGEALVDAMEIADQACWGGVPRTFKDTIEEQLLRHGFANGYADCFDERFRHDLFGWEFIDQGVSADIMWTTYQQMREFVELTDSTTYDEQFDGNYQAAEWVERCDSRCMGKRCGACTPADLKIRTGYIRAAGQERHFDLSTLKPVDQRSQAFRVRARIHRPASHRFVDNSHWRFAVRRAAFRAQHALDLPHGIAKRSIRFASDGVKHRDWTCGVDYLEFGITRPMPPQDVQTFLDVMNRELDPWLSIGDWTLHAGNAITMRADVDLSFYDLELDDNPATVVLRLADWSAAATVPMRLKIEGGYFAPPSEEVDAKTYVDALWLVRHGHDLHLRMLVRGRPSPYNIYAALMRRASWLDAARNPATRLEAFIGTDRSQQDFLRPNCRTCGLQIPTTVLDRPYDPDHCPACKDVHDGIVVDQLDDI